ncbi:maleylpyruvate isomerase N-terminal domain-containing protein [Nonomuraea sp. NPDC049152]|uniref:maleylpyruvate isomerase N-terminal domain-containing protein n=1 Tax=Nonomuraea sp. NPDC049152 TaxID=3154350 RepID=UPI0033CE6B0E
MDLFSRSWTALRAAVAELPDEDFAQPSGCNGWLVRDLVCHLVIDAQDVLITLVTPAETEPTRDAVTYWDVAETPPTGDDPLDALIVRLAAAYREPRLLKFHLDDVGSAAGRAAGLADPGLRVSTRDEVLTAGVPRPTRRRPHWASWPRNSRSSSADRPADPVISHGRGGRRPPA